MSTWERQTDIRWPKRLRDDPSTHEWGAKWKRRAIFAWFVVGVLAVLLVMKRAS